MRMGSAVKFSVYRKATNKEYYINFFSAHSERVKSGIVICFFFLEHLESAANNIWRKKSNISLKRFVNYSTPRGS